MIKIIDIKAGEKDVFIRLNNKKGNNRLYELQSSEKKNSAQLTKADILKTIPN